MTNIPEDKFDGIQALSGPRQNICWTQDHEKYPENVVLISETDWNRANEAIAERTRHQAGTGGQVKALEWRAKGVDYFTDTPVGQYCVGLVHTRFRVVLRTIVDGQWADVDVWSGGGVEAAKAAAQADYEARIMSALSHPAPPSEHAAIDRDRAMKAAVSANHAFGQWMPERWLHLFMDAYEATK